MTQGAHAPLRPPQDEVLRFRQPAVFAGLPVSVRVLRHHRDVRPPPPDQDRQTGHRRARRDLQSGTDLVFIVDDNLIGNKKAIKEVLRDVIAWQKRNNYG